MTADDFGPAAFARALYGEALADDRRAVVWAKGNGAVWCQTADEVQAVASARSTKHDVYLGACLQSASAERAGSRGEAATVTCLPGVWVDIDVLDPGHKSAAYPPSADAALAHLAARVPQPPTLVIATGGGLHAWWLLDEPWVLESDGDRAEAASLVMRVQGRVRLAWAEKGWRLDPTADLARVMRIPGTWNRKIEPARPVFLLESREMRHAPSDLLDGCPTIHAPAPVAVAQSGDGLVIDATREPPGSKLLDLCEVDGRFKLTWQRKRHDLTDTSQSGYDYALILRALAAGWTDQEIVDLCVAHRRRGGQPPKRLDYYTGSLARAKSAALEHERQADRTERETETRQAQTAATERLLDTAATGSPTTPEVHAGVLSDLREALGLPIVGIRKHLLDPPTWDLLLDSPTHIVKLGTVEWAMRQGTFRARVAETLDIVLPALKPAKWEPIAQLMLKLAERTEYPEVSEHAGLMEGLVRDYLNGHVPADDVAGAARKGSPILRDGKAGLYLTHFRGWLDRVEGEKMTRGRVATMLKREGWERDKVSLGGSSRAYWIAPRAWPWPVSAAAAIPNMV